MGKSISPSIHSTPWQGATDCQLLAVEDVPDTDALVQSTAAGVDSDGPLSVDDCSGFWRETVAKFVDIPALVAGEGGFGLVLFSACEPRIFTISGFDECSGLSRSFGPVNHDFHHLTMETKSVNTNTMNPFESLETAVLETAVAFTHTGSPIALLLSVSGMVCHLWQEGAKSSAKLLSRFSIPRKMSFLASRNAEFGKFATEISLCAPAFGQDQHAQWH